MNKVKRIKEKTNEQMLHSLLKELSTIDAALLRERIVKMMEITCQAIARDPESFYNPIVHPSCYTELAKMVEKTMGFGTPNQYIPAAEQAIRTGKPV